MQNYNFKSKILNRLDINQLIWIAGVVAATLLVVFLFWWRWGENIIGFNNEDGTSASKLASLTGLNCGDYSKRPVAIMMASDPIARPLSGLSQADIVIEMPVTPNGITRMMALFQCGKPEEIGSIRSARQDFIPLADSFKAIYAHWGGEREALSELDNGVINNIDAMKYEGTVFYRKNSVPRPHNGFTTIELLRDKAEDLGYELGDSFQGFARSKDKPERNLSNTVSTVLVGYESPFNVSWVYNSSSNTYKRNRGGEPEIDKSSSEQIEASTIVVMHTTSKVLSIDYISVATVGEGKAEFYQNGIRLNGTWEHSGGNLKFYDATGQEIKFLPGKMWIEIVTQ